MSDRDELRALIYDYCERSSAWDDVATEAANAILDSDWLGALCAAIWDEAYLVGESFGYALAADTTWGQDDPVNPYRKDRS